MARRSPEMLLSLFVSQPVVTLEQIQAALDQASRATAFRYLQKVPYRRSYNHNGRFYTKYDPNCFNRFGLWSHGDVFFSRDGSLKLTIRRLVHEAEMGYTHRELRELLGVQVQFALSEAVSEQTINREQLGGFYVYVHTLPEVKEVQLENRRKKISAVIAAELNDALVIQVLLVLIKHPGSSPGDVVHHLRGCSPPISRAQVDAVFARYSIDEKKTKPSTS